MVRIDDTPAVWVFLVEHGLDYGSDLQLYWNEAAAVDAACQYLSTWLPPEELATAAGVREAVAESNHSGDNADYLVLAPFPIVGNQYFEGDVDDRPRCQACREPIELDDPEDPESWIHCEDANDLGDHTAQR